MKKNLVSIIIPVYQVEEYIEQCLESIVKQTYRNIEVYLIDDGSPDKCPQICDEWGKIDNRIHVIHQENKGVSVARNRALNQIDGEYIMFVDSDDWINETMVERLINKIRENPEIDAVFCGYTEFDEQGTQMIQSVIPNFNNIVDRDTGVATIFGKYSTMLWNKLFRASLLHKKIWFRPELKIGEDELWMVEVLKGADKIALISDPLYNYRKRASGASKDYSLSPARLSEIESQKLVLQEIYDYNSHELTILAQERMYYSCQRIMKIAFYQRNFELFSKIDRDIADVRKVWYSHHQNILGSCRRKIVEMMMRLRLPAKFVKILDK